MMWTMSKSPLACFLNSLIDIFVGLLIYIKLYMTFATKDQSEFRNNPFASLIINKDKVAYIRPFQSTPRWEPCKCSGIMWYVCVWHFCSNVHLEKGVLKWDELNMQNAMISSIVHVTNLPRRRVVKWFEEKRADEGVPDEHRPYRRKSSESVFTQ